MRSTISSMIFHRRSRNADSYLFHVFTHRRGYAASEKEGSGLQKQTQNIKKYWLNRYVDYIKNYQSKLEKNFPKTMHAYRVFSLGTKDFFSELKRYIVVRKVHRTQGMDALTHRDLQLWHTFPKDLIKISPLLFLSAIPFTNYIIFPMAFMFPRLFMTSHYWSLEQRFNFMLHHHRKKIKHNKPLFRCLQSKLKGIEDRSLKTRWGDVIACLGSGTHPTTQQILYCVQLFSGPPYSLESLPRKHMKELLAVHGMRTWVLFKRRKLLERGILIQKMDNAINREGGPSKLSYDAIRWAVSFRGVNPANMSRESMQDWLENWMLISSKVDQRNMSLLLHCPILLAYNHPTNWTLLYHKSIK